MATWTASGCRWTCTAPLRHSWGALPPCCSTFMVRISAHCASCSAACAQPALRATGGGWLTGHRAFVFTHLLHHLCTQGWVVVAINYRLAPRSPMLAQVQDCKRAIVWVKRNIARFGGDPEFVACAGESAGTHSIASRPASARALTTALSPCAGAGGHLSLMMALTQNRPEYISTHLRARLGCPSPLLARSFTPSFYQPFAPAADTSVRACVDLYGAHDVLDHSHAFAERGQPGGIARFMSRHACCSGVQRCKS